ncbi:MAG TPA: class I adenylate-forming enzyme family protein [Deltaproteobacteria bacterium]|mgnify:FL=1|nr:class I adenylate-forming enzyme family protein [Deltaproteobacteria bacterium]
MAEFVHHFLESSADRYPEKTAVLHGEITATFREVNSFANRLSTLLRDNGLKKGDRVLMAAENSLESIASYYGILKAGGVCVEVPDKSTLTEMEYFIENSGARICILSKGSAKRLADIVIPCIIGPDMPFTSRGVNVYTWEDVHRQKEYIGDPSLCEDDLAAIVYTSGSTGRPKGVMLTHKNLCTNTASIVSYLGLSETDRIMAVLPFYYVYGKTLLNTHFMVGGSIVINNRFAFPNAVVKDMVDKEVTGFAGVPSTFAILLNRSVFTKTQIPTLRYITQAGGAMAPALTERLLKHIGMVSLYIMYGATEASARLTYLPPQKLLDNKRGSIGVAIPGVEITIRDNKGTLLKPYEVGNICATGDNIMQGYWQDKEETDNVLKQWGLVTGDLGHMDEDGYIYLTGRKKEMLKIGGERVSPKEIEEAIMESGLVHEVAVVGRPDEFLSEVPEAFIVPLDEKTFDLEEVKSFANKRLSVHKHPKYWNVLKTLPKKPSGKIDKGVLKQ